MDKKESNKIEKSVGKIIGWICRMTTTVLVVLRACDVIDWPWWKVMMPTFISLGVVLLILVFCGVAVAIAVSTEE
jgi:hypothetical protein